MKKILADLFYRGSTPISSIVPYGRYARIGPVQAPVLAEITSLDLLSDLRHVVNRRNELAHGTLYRTFLQIVPIQELAQRDVDMEWRIHSRRDRSSRKITMLELRKDLYEAIGCFMAMLELGDRLLRLAPRPRHFHATKYLATPSS